MGAGLEPFGRCLRSWVEMSAEGHRARSPGVRVELSGLWVSGRLWFSHGRPSEAVQPEAAVPAWSLCPPPPRGIRLLPRREEGGVLVRTLRIRLLCFNFALLGRLRVLSPALLCCELQVRVTFGSARSGYSARSAAPSRGRTMAVLFSSEWSVVRSAASVPESKRGTPSVRISERSAGARCAID